MLFDNLMKFCDDDDATTGAYFKDFVFHTKTYRVFACRLMPYSVYFNHPDALWCRGILFDLSDTSVPVCRPPKKFFNAHEGNRKFDYSKTISITEKLDGSLISTFSYVDEITGNIEMAIKSKTSVISDVANLANEYLSAKENTQFQIKLACMTRKHITVNMEITSPDNWIVIDYNNGTNMTVLNAINNRTGEFLTRKQLVDFFGGDNHIVKEINVGDTEKFIGSIFNMKGIEGFVVDVVDETTFDGHTNVKIKTEEYVIKHKLKGQIDSPKGLFESVCLGISDDIKGLYTSCSKEVTVIENMEKFVLSEINKLEKSCVDFYKENKNLSRKEYAILGKKYFSDIPCGFGISMKKFISDDVIEIDYQRDIMDAWKFYKDKV